MTTVPKDSAADVTRQDVCVIIVNYGTADLALEAAASVLARAERVHSLHIVDNASPGPDAARMADAIASRAWGDRVTLHAEKVNHGFGRGNNLVIAALLNAPAPPDKIFLLNPDATLGNDAVTLLANFLDAHPQAGAVGARIEKPGGIPVTAAFRFPGLISTFSDAVAFGPLSRLCARWQVPLPATLPTGPVDWVAGAALMLRTAALRDAQMFDPAFFLYYEEVDLMRQTARAGWQTWYLAEALVLHAEGAATGVKSGRPERRRLPAYWYQSWQYYMRKNHGRAAALLACLLWASGALMNHGLSRLRGKQPAAPLQLFGDLWAFAIRPLLGLKTGTND
jgi:N-acetylglucosaminyl-diphospho-decaprenol L-rhamnosyltransferase